jgi:hypothetical protein
MMDEDLLALILKLTLFAVICLSAGALLAHWMVWG